MATSPPPPPQRQRSNSFPIVEALGCSTPEAKLILAEGQAARRKRRAHSRRNQSVNDTTSITTFRPQDHMQYLQALSPQTKSDQSQLSHSKSCHARIPSDATDRSSATVVPPVSSDGQSRPNASPTSPLGNYSAHLAQFIKAQLSNIPTYTGECSTALLSPRSCPDLPSGRESPPSPQRIARRPLEAPKVIEIPPVQPPVRSQFSAWSSADDESEDDGLSMVDAENEDSDVISKGSNYTPSVLHYYGVSNNSSFLLSSTPLEEDSPDTAKASTFPHREPSPSAVEYLTDDDTGYPSSAISRPELASSSAPSITSTASTSSYFECKRPLSLTDELKGRIMAAVMPPTTPGKTIAAVSPWEGAPLSNVHDVFVESQHRVHVDGMSFDMQRDFVLPSHIGTPC